MAIDHDSKDTETNISHSDNNHSLTDNPAINQPSTSENLNAAEHTNADTHDIVDTERHYSTVHQGEHISHPKEGNIVAGKSDIEAEINEGIQTHQKAHPTQTVRFFDRKTDLL